MSYTVASGNGGSIKIGSSAALNTNRWTLRQTSRLAEHTHSGVTATNYEPVVPDHSWEAELAVDVSVFPTGMGLTRGAKATVTFKYGGTAGIDVLTGTTIESVEVVDDNAADIIRLRVSGRGGVLTDATAGE